MAHFAKLDENNIVTTVIVVDNGIATSESAGVTFINNLYGTSDTWKQTSYNTVANTHLGGGTPFRKNYAGVGYTYDADKNAFIPPKPFASWVLDNTTCQWIAPITITDDNDGRYFWNETLYQSDNTKGWVKEDKS
jgi:hypothetical protein